MISISKGDIIAEPLSYLIGKLLGKAVQEIFNTFEMVPFQEWTSREWGYIFYLLLLVCFFLMLVIWYLSKIKKKIICLLFK